MTDNGMEILERHFLWESAQEKADFEEFKTNFKTLANRITEYEAANITLNEGHNLLHAATENDNDTVAKFLISKGADVECKTRDGFTPLHTAADNNAYKVASLLLKSNCKINFKIEIDLIGYFVPHSLLHTFRHFYC